MFHVPMRSNFNFGVFLVNVSSVCRWQGRSFCDRGPESELRATETLRKALAGVAGNGDP